MRVKGMARSLCQQAENDMELFSALFEVQKIHNYETVSKDLFAAKNGSKTFVLTSFGDGFALVDVIPAGNVKVEMLKRDSIRKLLEIKRGNFMPMEDSLVGSALPMRP